MMWSINPWMPPNAFVRTVGQASFQIAALSGPSTIERSYSFRAGAVPGTAVAAAVGATGVESSGEASVTGVNLVEGCSGLDTSPLTDPAGELAPARHHFDQANHSQFEVRTTRRGIGDQASEQVAARLQSPLI